MPSCVCTRRIRCISTRSESVCHLDSLCSIHMFRRLFLLSNYDSYTCTAMVELVPNRLLGHRWRSMVSHPWRFLSACSSHATMDVVPSKRFVVDANASSHSAIVGRTTTHSGLTLTASVCDSEYASDSACQISDLPPPVRNMHR